jgi:hypothetical protein
MKIAYVLSLTLALVWMAVSICCAGANPSILIWDNDRDRVFPHPDSIVSPPIVGCEELIEESLARSGYTDITVSTDLPVDLSSYGVIFVCLGWRDSEHDTAGTITLDEQSRLAMFLASTGPIYIEGNDFARDYDTTGFLQLFGAEYLSDGEQTANLTHVTGIAGTFTENLEYEYLYTLGPDSYPDEIWPGGPEPGFRIFEGSPCRGIARLDPGKANKVADRTVLLSFVFGALRDAPARGVSTKVELMSRIMEFFGFGPTSAEPPSGSSWGTIKELMK